jgi:hypothetical protein
LAVLHGEDVTEEYEALNANELAEIVAHHQDNKAQRVSMRRPTARGRIQNIIHTVKQMSQLVSDLIHFRYILLMYV